jgi:hypothetical protein
VDFVLRFCEEGLEGKERSSKNAYAQAAARPGMHRPQNQRNAGKSARLARVSARERPTLRVFVSSPADVRPERLLAERVVQRLDREFSHHLRLETVMWEHEPLLASHHFQERITPPHETDIVVVILWSRLGLALPHDKFPGPLSMKGVTGTEWEFEDTLKSHRERNQPDILLYRKQADVTGSLNDETAVYRRLQQMQQVRDFFQQWFVDVSNQLAGRLAGRCQESMLP